MKLGKTLILLAINMDGPDPCALKKKKFSKLMKRIMSQKLVPAGSV